MQQQGGAAREQQQGGAVREQSVSGQETWAERAAKRGRPGDVDSEGFRVPGRPARKAVPKGCSTVDLTELGGAVVAPVEKYVGGTELHMSKEKVEQLLRKCATDVEGGDKLVILSVEKLTGHASARTSSWRVTVPYSCRQLLDNPAMYPGGWTFRAFFAPRGDRNKRQQGGGGEALLQERTAEEQERWQRAVDAGVAAKLATEIAAKLAEAKAAAVPAVPMEGSPA